MNSARSLLFLAGFLVFSGCSRSEHPNIRSGTPTVDAPARSSMAVSVPVDTAPAPSPQEGEEWIPDFEVVCKAEHCPLQVGLLIRPNAPKDGMISFTRCTAFLIAPNKIMTGGHCDNSEIDGYFITQKVEGRKIQRKINKVPAFKQFVEGTVDPATGRATVSGQMDAAIFELETPIDPELIPPFTLAEGRAQDTDKLYAYVLNRGENANEFQMEMLVCEARRHESIFPYDLSEMPDIITTFGCETRLGNSGAPLLRAFDSTVVEAIHYASESLDEAVERVRTKEGREPFIYEKHMTAWATNVRCLSLPGRTDANCIHPGADEIARRFAESQRRSFDLLNSRVVPNASAYNFNFTSYSYQLRVDDGTSDRQFEVYYQPTCRHVNQPPSEVDFPVENLKLKYNEWAERYFESVELKVPKAKVEASHPNEMYTLSIQWPSPFGELLNPSSLRFREAWGSSFSIAIPVCAR